MLPPLTLNCKSAERNEKCLILILYCHWKRTFNRKRSKTVILVIWVEYSLFLLNKILIQLVFYLIKCGILFIFYFSYQQNRTKKNSFYKNKKNTIKKHNNL